MPPRGGRFGTSSAPAHETHGGENGEQARRSPEMYGVQTQTARFSISKLSVWMTLASSICVTAQNALPGHNNSARTAGALPKSCLIRGGTSEKISALLETIQDHPTAGAYNTLGVLYAQAGRVSCAIPSFETSLELENRNWEAHYNLALALLQKGDRSRAERELQTAMQQKPDSVSSHFALGTLFESEKKLGQAEEQLGSALKIDPHFTVGALKLAQVLISDGKPQAAVACLEDAVKQALPEQAEPVRAALGVAYAESGEMERALETLRSLVASYPDSADAHFNLGLQYARPGQPTDGEVAASEFRQALRLDDRMDAARIALGRILISSQKYSDAISILVEYTRRQPKDAQGFYVLGLAYEGLKKSDAAINALQRAAVLDPKDSAVHFYLGMLLASAGKMDEAIVQFDAAERINPSDPETHKELALLLEKAGEKQRAHVERTRLAALKSDSEKESVIARFNQEANQYLLAGNAKAAAESYKKAVQLDPHDPKLHYNLSLALDKLGEFSSERKELERAIKLDPRIAVVQNQLGLLALHSGQRAEAELRFKKTLAINPTFAEAQSNLGVLYSQEGKNSEATTLFQQAIRNDPKYTKAYVNFGLLLAQQGALAEAEQQFRMAIGVDSNYPDAYAAFGMLQAKTGRGAEAVTNFQKAVTLEPASAQAHLNLGIALVDEFDRPAAFKEFSEAARLDPQLAAAHYNLGRFFFETGKYEDAGRELETATHLQPDYAAALYFLALTAKQENQPERSTELLQRVVALQPDNADAQYLLGQNLEHADDNSSAIQHWKAAVQADPNHSQALYNLAKALNKIHDPDAKQYQDRFDALQMRQQIADRVSELGNFALEAANAQNWPQALEQMHEAIQLCGNCPQSAHLHKNLGLFYGRTGNIGEAEKELRTALQLAPNDADAQNALAMLEHAHEDQVK
ncbi:MAG TPA: tetratricopeptide repeat protein [Terriglobales bacterium]|nr:tetratricopeptide repeat protein [Terriglobales bacterium]